MDTPRLEAKRSSGCWIMFLARTPKVVFISSVLAVLFGLSLVSAILSSSQAQTTQGPSPVHTHHLPKSPGDKGAQPGPAPKQGPGHQRMLDLLRQLAAQDAHDHPFMGDGRVLELSGKLAELEASSSKGAAPAYWGNEVDRWQVLLDLGIAELRLGRLEDGTEHLLSAYRLLPKIKPYIQKSAADQTIFELGVGYIRFGETMNCALQHNVESCLLPLRGKGIHTLREGSTKAVQYFTELLENTSPDEPGSYYYACLWLLNIAQMTLGQYPDKGARTLSDTLVELRIGSPVSALSQHVMEVGLERPLTWLEELSLKTLTAMATWTS
ncbi:MAG: hypothetical protein U0V70_20935 [Terriglobia bacterium]